MLGLKKKKNLRFVSKVATEEQLCVWTGYLTYQGLHFHFYWMKDITQWSPRSPLWFEKSEIPMENLKVKVSVSEGKTDLAI